MTLRRQEERGGYDGHSKPGLRSSKINDGARPDEGARLGIINADVRCICTRTLAGDFGASARPGEQIGQEIGRPRRRRIKGPARCAY